DDESYKLTWRGHSVRNVAEATAYLKDSAFKVGYHLMPGLPGSDAEKDLRLMRKVFEDPAFKPDMVKIYPCLVIEGTKLYELWEHGKFHALTSVQAAKLIAKMKEFIPPWVRVMRIQRDIPAPVITAGVKKSNLRQLVQEELERNGTVCRCIRCREAGVLKTRFGKETDLADFRLFTQNYGASAGTEVFISFESPRQEVLGGFCRLRVPAHPFRKEIDSSTGLIRELHVYGEALGLGTHKEKAVQHRGIGKKLMLEAERVAREEFDLKKMAVISGLGVKEYYRGNFGYSPKGPYEWKLL
ncbi:MAG: tRNA uridine(34) 5-carboxymethylaminomethyl modification radical SAM/GNAT enzyme Elp3, partial [Candidatus Diapherotrites archaeon]|nr:tRNA uridine(34) 5-carboxymethylaminomethyl modification radical SAM/GNAT enzyme Elp3 [Candidatus Diapherotrites archaeon]